MLRERLQHDSTSIQPSRVWATLADAWGINDLGPHLLSRKCMWMWQMYANVVCGRICGRIFRIYSEYIQKVKSTADIWHKYHLTPNFSVSLSVSWIVKTSDCRVLLGSRRSGLVDCKASEHLF